MTRIERLLLDIRDVLADSEQSRWTTPRLIRLIDEAHRDIATRTRLLKGTYNLYPIAGQALYTLPDDVWLLVRAKYLTNKVDQITFDTIDEYIERPDTSLRRNIRTAQANTSRYTAAWENDTGAPAALILDNHDLNIAQLYPIPDEDTQDVIYTVSAGATLDEVLYVNSNAFGTLTDVAAFETLLNDFGFVTSSDSVYFSDLGVTVVLPVSLSSEFGILAAVTDSIPDIDFGAVAYGITTNISDFTDVPAFGVITALNDIDIDVEVMPTFGVITRITEASNPVIISYIKSPDTIETEQDLLLTHPTYDVAIKHYVVGHAFRDDKDVRSLGKASEALGLYEKELKKASAASSSDGSAVAYREIPYKGGIQ